MIRSCYGKYDVDSVLGQTMRNGLFLFLFPDLFGDLPLSPARLYPIDSNNAHLRKVLYTIMSLALLLRSAEQQIHVEILCPGTRGPLTSVTVTKVHYPAMAHIYLTIIFARRTLRNGKHSFLSHR